MWNMAEKDYYIAGHRVEVGVGLFFTPLVEWIVGIVSAEMTNLLRQSVVAEVIDDGGEYDTNWYISNWTGELPDVGSTFQSTQNGGRGDVVIKFKVFNFKIYGHDRGSFCTTQVMNTS